MAVITEEILQEKLKALQIERINIVANANALNGAIQILEHLLAGESLEAKDNVVEIPKSPK